VRDVALVPVGAVDLALIDYLALIIHEVLRVSAHVTDRPLSPDFAYDAIRRQHHSTKLLSRLKSEWGSDGTIALGVSELDLYIPILTFVFGEAELGGDAAVISTARLAQSFYGLPEDDRLLYQRAEKEALHELGHAFGLIHCSLYECVMHFSNSAEEVDLKGDRYCPQCSEKITVSPRRDAS
jgi:archaemetzincin